MGLDGPSVRPACFPTRWIHHQVQTILQEEAEETENMSEGQEAPSQFSPFSPRSLSGFALRAPKQMAGAIWAAE